MPLIPFVVSHSRLSVLSPHRPHSPSITYAIIPFLNSYSTTHSFFLLYSIHHSPLSYLHPILHHPHIPFPFFLSNSILIALHLSLILFQSILHHPHIPFPFFLSNSILIALHLPPILPISFPSFTYSFPHSLSSSCRNRNPLTPITILPPLFASRCVRAASNV